MATVPVSEGVTESPPAKKAKVDIPCSSEPTTPLPLSSSINCEPSSTVSTAMVVNCSGATSPAVNVVAGFPSMSTSSVAITRPTINTVTSPNPQPSVSSPENSPIVTLNTSSVPMVTLADSAGVMATLATTATCIPLGSLATSSLPNATSTLPPGGISLTITNGVINLKGPHKVGSILQHPGIRPAQIRAPGLVTSPRATNASPVTMVKGPPRPQMVSGVGPGSHTQLKIPNPGSMPPRGQTLIKTQPNFAVKTTTLSVNIPGQTPLPVQTIATGQKSSLIGLSKSDSNLRPQMQIAGQPIQIQIPASLAGTQLHSVNLDPTRHLQIPQSMAGAQLHTVSLDPTQTIQIPTSVAVTQDTNRQALQDQTLGSHISQFPIRQHILLPRQPLPAGMQPRFVARAGTGQINQPITVQTHQQMLTGNQSVNQPVSNQQVMLQPVSSQVTFQLQPQTIQSGVQPQPQIVIQTSPGISKQTGATVKATSALGTKSVVTTGSKLAPSSTVKSIARSPGKGAALVSGKAPRGRPPGPVKDRTKTVQLLVQHQASTIPKPTTEAGAKSEKPRIVHPDMIKTKPRILAQERKKQEKSPDKAAKLGSPEKHKVINAVKKPITVSAALKRERMNALNAEPMKTPPVEILPFDQTSVISYDSKPPMSNEVTVGAVCMVKGTPESSLASPLMQSAISNNTQAESLVQKESTVSVVQNKPLDTAENDSVFLLQNNQQMAAKDFPGLSLMKDQEAPKAEQNSEVDKSKDVTLKISLPESISVDKKAKPSSGTDIAAKMDDNQNVSDTKSEKVNNCSEDVSTKDLLKRTEDKGDNEMKVSSAEPESEGDFDMVSAMTWDNGIGTLEGSDLKFRMNEFGLMEMITDDITNGDSSGKNKVAKQTMLPVVKPEGTGGLTCENCGIVGDARTFCKTGRFCSQTCVGRFAGKRNIKRFQSIEADGSAKATDETGSIPNKVAERPKMLMGLKKKKRKFLLDKDGKSGLKVVIPDEEELTRIPYIPGKKCRNFSWSQYLTETTSAGAPPKLFKEPFPVVIHGKHGFKIGMSLEGVDPMHQSLYCVLSIAEIQGYRLRLHFDGYSECYDYWTNSNSPFIFPCGWCERNGKSLQPPKNHSKELFTWNNYFKMSKGQPAPKNLFSNQPATMVTPNAFRVAGKLEAVDKKNLALICVATVADTLGDKVLIHFDGWEDCYDYWCDTTSPYIHPVGWCQKNGRILSPPFDWKEVKSFTWEDYLTVTKSSAIPARAFKPRTSVGFEVDMKIEVVDLRNPILVRAATICEVIDYQVKIHFDGWSDMYDYYLDDDSPDIHPPGWCAKTGHILQPPFSPSDLVHSPGQSGCPTPGCRGSGHIKGAKYTGHHSAFGCPYSTVNLNREPPIQDRLLSVRNDDTPALPTSAKVSPDFDIWSFEEPRKCPTQGCNGSGHITGRFTAHHKLSGCPLNERNIERYQEEMEPVRTYTGAKRGRKRHKFLHMGDRNGRPHKIKRESRDETFGDGEEALHNGIHQSVFMSSMVPNPAKDLSLCWEQHSKLLPGVDKIRTCDVSKWSMDEVASFVHTLPGCKEQGKIFKEEQIDGEAFLLLTQTDIVKIMNIKLGPALKIFNSILMFKNAAEV